MEGTDREEWGSGVTGISFTGDDAPLRSGVYPPNFFNGFERKGLGNGVRGTNEGADMPRRKFSIRLIKEKLQIQRARVGHGDYETGRPFGAAHRDVTEVGPVTCGAWSGEVVRWPLYGSTTATT